MKLVSVNVGFPREVIWQASTVSTGIFKEPLTERVKVRTLNLDGDRQADLTVHGGPTKAVYAYPAEHYPYWRAEFPNIEMPWGMFGENLTVEGLFETELNIGDQFRMGTAELMVTSPRIPCYKLGIRFGRKDIVPRFLKSRRSGFYLAVLKEGELGTGDQIEVLSRAEGSVTVTEVVQLYDRREDPNYNLLRRAIGSEALPASWKQYFSRMLEAAKT